MENSSLPLVSVIVPLYNQERYFGSCIRSICKQSYSNLEIIIVNDASTDKSLSIVKRWMAKDSRIKLIDKERNEGAAKARLDGLNYCAGEFYFPVDSDDYLPKDAIEILVNHMIGKNVDVVLGSMTKVLGWIKSKNHYDYGNFPFHKVVSQPELFDEYYLGFFGKFCFPIMMISRLFRMSMIKKAMMETDLISDEFPFVGEDHFFNMKVFPYLRSMYRTDENIYFYRYGGLSSSHFSPGYTDLLKFSDFRLSILDEKGLDEGYPYLFQEYAHCVYYHAQQLLQFNKADKNGVITFFKEEFSSRTIAHRLIDYYSKVRTNDYGLQLMILEDYEGMYQHADALMRKRCGTAKNKFVRLYSKLLRIF